MLMSMSPVYAMGSLNYQIPWDSINTGGNDSSSSTNYGLQDTIGQTSTGESASANYQVTSGYRAGSDVFRLSFTVHGQSPTVSMRYGQIHTTDPEYVVVSSTVGLVAGDYVAVVQDGGYSGLAAVGRVIGIVGDILTIDRWDGDAAFMEELSSGSDDYVYKLDSTSVPLGAISSGSERVGLVGGSIFSSASSGHTVYIQGDGDLSRIGGGGTITPVSDGAVSSDSEEYGAETLGPYAVNAGVDVAVTSTQRAVVMSTVPATTTPDRFLMQFKLGVSSATLLGDYRQTVYFTLTSNF